MTHITRNEVVAAGAVVALLALGACARERDTFPGGAAYRAATVQSQTDHFYRDRPHGRVERDRDDDGVPDRHDRYPRDPNRQ